MFIKMKCLGVIFCFTTLVFSCEKKDKETPTGHAMKELTIKQDSLIEIINTLNNKSEYNYWLETYFDESPFLEKGISNPVEFIKLSLREKIELIPIKAVLGGTMSFGKIQILSSKWLIADYDDGHVLGASIYEFKLNKENKLEFKTVRSLLPE